MIYSKKELAAMSLIFAISITIVAALETSGGWPAGATGTVVNVHNIYEGGDAHNYYNLTVSYRGTIGYGTVQCDFYNNANASIPIDYMSAGWLYHPATLEIDRAALVPGCEP